MVDRGRVSGRHFAVMTLVVAGEAHGAKKVEPSSELRDLMEWGYVLKDDGAYRPTIEGQRVWETWERMKDVGRE